MPDDEGSWTDLPYPNTGHMAEDAGNAGNYTLDSAAYPDAGGVYFSSGGFSHDSGDLLTTKLGDFTLQQARNLSQ